MALGALAIALSSATEREHSSWQDAAAREGKRYSVETEYVRAGLSGREYKPAPPGRSWLDWLLILGTTAVFIVLGAMAKFPQVEFNLYWTIGLTAVMIALLVTCGLSLWRTTRFR